MTTAGRLIESPRLAETAFLSRRVGAGEHVVLPVDAGQTLRIVDLEGNQAVDALFYNRDDLTEHYSATATIAAQGGIYLTTGTALMSNLGRPLAEIVADTCGRHDTLGGACSAESNTVRYALGKKYMHSCRDNFILALSLADVGLSKRDVVPNINFFMNVPVTKDGGLAFADGLSAPGKYVEIEARANLWFVASNCPQLNNPCNAYNPTPIELLLWRCQ